MELAFSKYEGLGNDFVIVDAADAVDAIGRDEAILLCDRHLGIGADGVLTLAGSGDSYTMTVWNADGSNAEMCGNGIRCVALHLANGGALSGDSVDIDTTGGPHRCRVLRAGRTGSVEVAMVAPRFDPARVPVDADAPMVDAKLDVDGVSLQITALSMGNPHAVTFDDVGERRLSLGPAVERHPRFPNGANAGFGRMNGGNILKLHVWERGVGWTRACGTGACAAAVAAVESGRAERNKPLRVQLPGGELSIVVGAAGERVSMTGPARHVYDGTFCL